MATPNQMPKRPNKLRIQIVEGLISLSPATWEYKKLSRDDDGKEVVETSRVKRSVLRFPFSQNISEENVERLSRRWL